MESITINFRVGSRNTLLPFQHGILMIIIALLGLYSNLKDEFAITHLLTCRLNKDCLEIFFHKVRGASLPELSIGIR